jgi:small subunit ribosomal protein S21
MLSIPVKEGDNIERALKRFKKKFDRTKRMRELRVRKEFVKPSVINREQHKKAVY